MIYIYEKRLFLKNRFCCLIFRMEYYCGKEEV